MHSGLLSLALIICFINKWIMKVGTVISSIIAQRNLWLQKVGGCRFHPQSLCNWLNHYSGIFKWGRFPAPSSLFPAHNKKELSDLFWFYDLSRALSSLILFIKSCYLGCSCFKWVHLSWLSGNFRILSSEMESMFYSTSRVECTGQDTGHSPLGMLISTGVGIHVMFARPAAFRIRLWLF